MALQLTAVESINRCETSFWAMVPALCWMDCSYDREPRPEKDKKATCQSAFPARCFFSVSFAPVQMRGKGALIRRLYQAPWLSRIKYASPGLRMAYNSINAVIIFDLGCTNAV